VVVGVAAELEGADVEWIRREEGLLIVLMFGDKLFG
jgi:hypothetical protein